jgi:hypothetical protein
MSEDYNYYQLRRIIREEQARNQKIEACTRCTAGLCQSCGYNAEYLRRAGECTRRNMPKDEA